VSALDELVSDENARRREFPVVAHKTYLAHAAVCPLPACVARALREYVDAIERGGQFEYLHAPAETSARRRAASLIGARAQEIAFAPSTSAGLSMIAAGLPWQRGDSVVVYEGDFPSNVYPWLQLRARGVEVRAIPAAIRGVALDDVSARVDGSTRLVALSSVHFATGTRLDLDAIGAYLRARGVLFCVDAIQSLGAVPTLCTHVDFMVADAHKWLLGPQGIALLYVRSEHFERLTPALVGWKSGAASKDFSASERLTLADGARRYEPGSLNALGVVGLAAALELIERAGIATIAARLALLRQQLTAALVARDYELSGVSDSGIVAFTRAGADMRALQQRLDREQVIVSLRSDPLGRACVRVAPHFYNTPAELEHMLALIS
jgi:selenocysteine lyase/cysteine desulfurase